MNSNNGLHFFLAANKLDSLFEILKHNEYRLIAPTIRDGAITYDEVETAKELPVGMIDDQKSGHYRLIEQKSKTFFSYVVGAQSWKKYLHPSRIRLWQATKKKNGSFEVDSKDDSVQKAAFIGVRACDMNAIHVQDKVLMESAYVDGHYSRRRNKIFIVAVNCTRAGGTCFCASMKTGPRLESGFDLSLTEVAEKDEHYFVVVSGSKEGAKIIKELALEAATPEKVTKAEALVEKTAEEMGRKLNTTDIKELLYRNRESTHWDTVAERCMNCANCTMVCPTCFCTSVEDVTDLSGENAERWRIWDSCYTKDFSYVHGGSVRMSGNARYRQWITHKLASWIDQFGTSGCVGCGRCITWCPVGIDMTEEVQKLREKDSMN